MADIAITALPVATYADVNDVFCIVQGGVTKQLVNSLLFTNVSLTTPTLINATLGTPTSGNLSNCTGSPTLTAPALGAATATSLISSGPIALGAPALVSQPFIQSTNALATGQYVAGQGPGVFWNFGRDNVTTGYFIFGNNGVTVSTINSTTGVFTAVSDRRLKKNITPIKYGLSEVLALRPVMYNMKVEDDAKKKHLGLIAQEVKEVVDELVEDIDEDTQHYGLANSELVPILIKAIQELNAKIEVLEAKSI
jgi:hypothetical protein